MITFNTNKYSVFNERRNNPYSKYTPNNNVLGHSICERDLGVCMFCILTEKSQLVQKGQVSIEVMLSKAM